jgi:hypothetical protein
MTFEALFQRDADLLENDATLSLGWFELRSGEMTLSLFNRRLCMVFISLTDLLHWLHSKDLATGGVFNWVGCDNGAAFSLRFSKDLLEIACSSFRCLVDFQQFKMAVSAGAISLLEGSRERNPQIVAESAYVDLKAAVLT